MFDVRPGLRDACVFEKHEILNRRPGQPPAGSDVRFFVDRSSTREANGHDVFSLNIGVSVGNLFTFRANEAVGSSYLEGTSMRGGFH